MHARVSFLDRAEITDGRIQLLPDAEVREFRIFGSRQINFLLK